MEKRARDTITALANFAIMGGVGYALWPRFADAPQAKPLLKVPRGTYEVAGDWYKADSELCLAIGTCEDAYLYDSKRIEAKGTVKIHNRHVTLRIGNRPQNFTLVTAPRFDMLIPDPGKDPKLSSTWIRANEVYADLIKHPDDVIVDADYNPPY